MNTDLTGPIILLLIALLIFLACREITCWYFKINSAIEEMKKQTGLLKKISETLQALQQEDEPQNVKA